MSASRPPLVDAHVHFWRLDGAIRYPWLVPPFGDDGPNGSVAAIARDYLPADYRADAAGWNIRGVVHVEAGADPADSLAETQWLEGLAAAEALPSAIVACADLAAPGLDALLAAHAARPRVRGIRQIVNWHADPARTYTPRDVTRDPAWAAGFATLARHRLSFDLQCYPGQVAGLLPLFAAHPDVPVILNHAGMGVDPGEDAEAAWRDAMAGLAALPHVAVKLSGFGFVHRAWRPEQIRGRFLTLIDLFGADRCLIASDMPTDKLFGSFARHLDTYDAFTAGASEPERRALFGGNANRLYRLGLETRP